MGWNNLCIRKRQRRRSCYGLVIGLVNGLVISSYTILGISIYIYTHRWSKVVFISEFYIVTGLFDWLWCVFMVFNVILLLFVNHSKDFFCDLQTAWRLVLSMKPWSYIWLEFGLFFNNYIYIYIYIYLYIRGLKLVLISKRGPLGTRQRYFQRIIFQWQKFHCDQLAHSLEK